MKLITDGHDYQIFPSDVETTDTLPTRVYNLRFSPMAGYKLMTSYDTYDITEKIYGDSPKKANKIMRTFAMMDRSLGVLFEGAKGTGKSLTTKLLITKALDENIPVIIVDQSYPNLNQFIASVDMRAMFVFDEFEKNFDIEDRDVSPTTQNDLLSTFDGMSTNQHLYVLTVNDDYKLSPFFSARPGRIHYWITFDDIPIETYQEYITDHMINDTFTKDIDAIAQYCSMFDMSFDSLRALCFELNLTDEDDYVKALDDVNLHDNNNADLKYEISADLTYVYKNKLITLRDFTCQINLLTGLVTAYQDNTQDVTVLVHDMKYKKLEEKHLVVDAYPDFYVNSFSLNNKENVYSGDELTDYEPSVTIDEGLSTFGNERFTIKTVPHKATLRVTTSFSQQKERNYYNFHALI